MVNKKAQFDAGIITFVVVIIALLFIAPILLKVVKIPLAQFSTSLSAVDPSNQSSTAVTAVSDSFTNWLDTIILLIFGFLVIVLLISAFMVDIHPAYMIVYIIAMIFLFILAPNALQAVTGIYSNSQFNDISTPDNNIVSHLPMSEFLVNNFFIVLLGIVILTGIIMFAKFRFGNGGGNSY